MTRRQNKPPATKHVHRPKPAIFPFRICHICGATATWQRYCLDCGKPFCMKCQERRRQAAQHEIAPTRIKELLAEAAAIEAAEIPAPAAPLSKYGLGPQPAERPAIWDNQGIPIPPPDIPIRARDILARFCRRYGINQDALKDRDYLELWRQCDLAAAALNAWQARTPEEHAQYQRRNEAIWEQARRNEKAGVE